MSAAMVFEATTENALELRLSDRFLYGIERSGPGADVTVRFHGRTGVRLLDAGRLDHTRVRELGVQVVDGPWSVDMGRFALAGGSYRLADGVQALHRTGRGWRIGAWAGLSPDPYTTAPALRFGGGPAVSWTSDVAQVEFLGEVLAVTDGIDRVTTVVSTHFKPSHVVQATTRLDLQYGGPTTPVIPADAGGFLWIRPSDKVTVNAIYNTYSSLHYAFTDKRDPAILRFAQRAQSVTGEVDIPQDEPDASLYHLMGASVINRAWTPQLTLAGRYRHHTLMDRRYGRVTATAGLPGLAKTRLELTSTTSWLWWGGANSVHTAITGWWEPAPGRLLALDASLQGGTARSKGEGPYGYGDLYVDWLAPRSVVLSGGYAFSAAWDGAWWDPMHTVMLRLSVRQRAKGVRP
jgi:hypothetical protein